MVTSGVVPIPQELLDGPVPGGRYALTVVLTIANVWAVVMNALLIALALRDPILRRQSSHGLLLNLGTAGLMWGVGESWPLLERLIMRGGRPSDSAFICGWQGTVAIASCALSLLSLGVLAVERYRVVLHRKHHSFTRVWLPALLVMWVLSAAIGSMPLYGVGHYGLHQSAILCLPRWWSHEPTDLLNTLLCLGCIMLPLNVCVYCYYRIFKHVKSATQSLMPLSANKSTEFNFTESPDGTGGVALALTPTGAMARASGGAAYAVPSPMNGAPSPGRAPTTLTFGGGLLSPGRALPSADSGNRTVASTVSATSPTPTAFLASPRNGTTTIRVSVGSTPVNGAVKRGSAASGDGGPGASGAVSPRNTNGIRERMEQREQVVARKMAVLVVSFLACWGCYAVLEIGQLVSGVQFPEWYDGLALFGGSMNALVNAHVFLYVNERLRVVFVRFVCCRSSADDLTAVDDDTGPTLLPLDGRAPGLVAAASDPLALAASAPGSARLAPTTTNATRAGGSSQLSPPSPTPVVDAKPPLQPLGLVIVAPVAARDEPMKILSRHQSLS